MKLSSDCFGQKPFSSHTLTLFCKESEINLVSTLLSSEIYGLSKEQGLTLSPMENLQVFLLNTLSSVFQYIPFYYPHAFLKKRRGSCNLLRPSVRPSVCLSVRSSVRLSVMLSPPKPLDEIQPNLVCELLT